MKISGNNLSDLDVERKYVTICVVGGFWVSLCIRSWVKVDLRVMTSQTRVNRSTCMHSLNIIHWTAFLRMYKVTLRNSMPLQARGDNK